MYIWPVQGPRSKQFCIWRPREAIPSRQVRGHTRTRESRLLKPRVLVRGGDARCNRAAAGGDARRDHPRCETQASASAPYECDPVIQWPRSHALKPSLIRFFFIRNSVFLLQIPPAFLQTIQIPPEFLQVNRPTYAPKTPMSVI